MAYVGALDIVGRRRHDDDDSEEWARGEGRHHHHHGRHHHDDDDDVDGTEEMGVVDIIGADGRRHRGRLRHPAHAAQVLNKFHGIGGKAVGDDKPDVARKQMAPLPLTTLAPGGEVAITIRPQRPFRGERLVIAGSNITGVVYLTQLLVQQVSQFINGGAIPVDCFFPTSFDVGVKFNTASPGIEVEFDFVNQAATGQPNGIFGGVVFGTSLT